MIYDLISSQLQPIILDIVAMYSYTTHYVCPYMIAILIIQLLQDRTKWQKQGRKTGFSRLCLHSQKLGNRNIFYELFFSGLFLILRGKSTTFSKLGTWIEPRLCAVEKEEAIRNLIGKIDPLFPLQKSRFYLGNNMSSSSPISYHPIKHSSSRYSIDFMICQNFSFDYKYASAYFKLGSQNAVQTDILGCFIEQRLGQRNSRMNDSSRQQSCRKIIQWKQRCQKFNLNLNLKIPKSRDKTTSKQKLKNNIKAICTDYRIKKIAA